jgi:hypothetical protein
MAKPTTFLKYKCMSKIVFFYILYMNNFRRCCFTESIMISAEEHNSERSNHCHSERTVFQRSVKFEELRWSTRQTPLEVENCENKTILYTPYACFLLLLVISLETNHSFVSFITAPFSFGPRHFWTFLAWSLHFFNRFIPFCLLRL